MMKYSKICVNDRQNVPDDDYYYYYYKAIPRTAFDKRAVKKDNINDIKPLVFLCT